MTNTDIKRLITGAAALLLALVFGLKWEKLLVVNPGGQIDVQYAQSGYDDVEYEEEEAGDEEEEYSSRGRKTKIKKMQLNSNFGKSGFGQNQSSVRFNLKKPEKTETSGTNTAARKGAVTAQKIYSDEEYLKAFYKFTNFRKHVFSINYQLAKEEYARLIARYGYRAEELDKLKAIHNIDRTKAWRENINRGQSAANRAVKAADDDYEAKMRGLLYKRHLALKASTKTIEPDIPHTVQDNKETMKPIAVAIGKEAAKLKYNYEDIIGTVLSFVQTAIIYKQPPMIENDIHIVGFFPPFRALLTGWGDCDTKSAVAGSILGNWPSIKMVGISIPNHYIMAVRAVPRKGDIFIRYNGLEYVLLEPAGPAWLPPGTVAENTKMLIARQDNYKIEPFFRNDK